MKPTLKWRRRSGMMSLCRNEITTDVSLICCHNSAQMHLERTASCPGCTRRQELVTVEYSYGVGDDTARSPPTAHRSSKAANQPRHHRGRHPQVCHRCHPAPELVDENMKVPQPHRLLVITVPGDSGLTGRRSSSPTVAGQAWRWRFSGVTPQRSTQRRLRSSLGTERRCCWFAERCEEAHATGVARPTSINVEPWYRHRG